MRSTDISSALRAVIPTKRPVFLWGPPGIGKSSLVRAAATQLGLPVIDIRAVLLDPVDLRGLPAVNGDHKAHWCQPAFLPTDGSGVLFLDELAQAPPLVQSACLQLTLDRRIGEYELPPGWTVIAASNRTEDRAGAHRLISPLLNRFIHLDLEVSVEDWTAWALENGIAPEVRSFIQYRPALLFSFDPSTGARSFPTPRSWSFASEILAVTPPHLLHPMVAGCVGEGPAAEFCAFLQLYRELPDMAKVLADPDGAKIPSEPSVLFATCGALVEHARQHPKVQNDAFAAYITRMPNEFTTLCFLDLMRVRKDIGKSARMAKWVSENRKLII